MTRFRISITIGTPMGWVDSVKGTSWGTSCSCDSNWWHGAFDDM